MSLHSENKQNQSSTKLSDLLSENARELLTVSGANFAETIGMDVIRNVVLDVLVGKNIRASTERLTRRRIAILNLAMVNLFIEGSKRIDNFVERLPHLAAEILSNNAEKTEQWLASWALGLTGKGIQNVLRDDRSLIPAYLDVYTETCRDVIRLYNQNYGNLRGNIELNSSASIPIDWRFFSYLLNMVGSQTLTIRGSEKSLYGKFFEKLVLGSLLHIIGFQKILPENLEHVERVFWLSSQSERERESDATLLYQPGRGVRFDIGFIGRGNTEISLDKVSRYRREIEIGREQYYMGTIIIVDRIGPRSRIRELANDIDGTIVQMSAGYWPQRVARILKELLDYEHELTDMDHDNIEDYLTEKIQEVPLMDFIRYASS